MRALLALWLPSPSTTSRREQAARRTAAPCSACCLTALIGLYLIPGGYHLPGGADRRVLGAAVRAAGQPAGAAVVGHRRQRRQRTDGQCSACAAFGDLLPLPLLCALAASTAIAAMFALRCLHPPGGAVALTAVIGGPAIHAAGFAFPLVTGAGRHLAAGRQRRCSTYNLTGRRYPHAQQGAQPNPHATRDAVPTVRLGFKPEDLDARAANNTTRCWTSAATTWHRCSCKPSSAPTSAASASSPAPTSCRATSSTPSSAPPLAEAWQLMRSHRVAALPVLNRARRVIGIVTQTDFLEHGGLDDYRGIRQQLQRFLRKSGVTHTEKAEVVGQIMTPAPDHGAPRHADRRPGAADGGLGLPPHPHRRRRAALCRP